MNNFKVAFCGLSHLGLTSAIAACARGFNVIAFDTDKHLIDKLRLGHLPISEPELDSTLKKYQKRIDFTKNPQSLSKCDVVYLSKDIKTDDFGQSDLTELEDLISIVKANIKTETSIVVHSQVPPGFTRRNFLSIDRVFYQVETLIFGEAYSRAMEPERYIIGCKNPSLDLPKEYAQFLKSGDCPVFRMKYESAELAKISINLMLVSSLTTANKLAELSEHIEADWSEIVPVLKLDKRIGRYAYINAGLGFSGGNLERDLSSVQLYSEQNDIDASWFALATKINSQRKNWIYQQVEPMLNDNPKLKLTVLGLAYKENTHSVKNSPSLLFLSKLRSFDVTVYDPVVDIKKDFTWCKSARNVLEAVTGADIVIVCTPWKEIINLDLCKTAKLMSGDLIIDPYRIFDENIIRENNLRSIVIGKSTRGDL